MIFMNKIANATNQLIHFPIKSSAVNDGSNLSGVAATSLITAPVSAPTLSGSVVTTGGQITGNTTIYVGYTIVSAYGESTISPLLTVSIPAGTNTNNFLLNLTSNAAQSQYFYSYAGSSTVTPFFYQNPGTTGALPPTSNGAYASELSAMWQRDVDTTATPFTPPASVAGTWSSGGFICPDSTNAPGVYELGIPNAALSNSGGATQVIISLWGAINMAYTEILITFGSSVVQLDMTQSVPTSNTSQTVGDALNAARAQGFGKWVITGTSLFLYAPDGTTVLRTFTLDSATTPTQRV